MQFNRMWEFFHTVVSIWTGKVMLVNVMALFLVYTQHLVQAVCAVDSVPWQRGCRSPWLWWALWRTSGRRHLRCCVLDLWIWWGRSLAPPLTEPPDCSCNTASQQKEKLTLDAIIHNQRTIQHFWMTLYYDWENSEYWMVSESYQTNFVVLL